MYRRSLIICFLFLSMAAFGKSGKKESLASLKGESSSLASLGERGNSVQDYNYMSGLTRYNGGDITKFVFNYSGTAGYGKGIMSGSKFITSKGGGFYGIFEIGLSYTQTNDKGDYTLISFGLGYEIMGTKEQVLDTAGVVVKDNIPTFKMLVVPVSYTKMHYFDDTKGIFYQGGLNIGYVTDFKNAHDAFLKNANKLLIQPFASAGMFFPFRFLNRQKEDVGGSQLLVGPVVSYIVNNMTGESGMSMNALGFGLKLTVVSIDTQ